MESTIASRVYSQPMIQPVAVLSGSTAQPVKFGDRISEVTSDNIHISPRKVIEAYTAKTGFPYLAKVSENIEAHAIEAIKTVSESTGIPVLYSGYSDLSSVARKTALPGSDLDGWSILVQGGRADAERFEEQLYQTVDPDFIDMSCRSLKDRYFSVNVIASDDLQNQHHSFRLLLTLKGTFLRWQKNHRSQRTPAIAHFDRLQSLAQSFQVGKHLVPLCDETYREALSTINCRAFDNHFRTLDRKKPERDKHRYRQRLIEAWQKPETSQFKPQESRSCYAGMSEVTGLTLEEKCLIVRLLQANKPGRPTSRLIGAPCNPDLPALKSLYNREILGSVTREDTPVYILPFKTD